MKVAIIGAGFSGLAVCWHLLNTRNAEDITITVMDPNGIGGGTSGIAAGLLHSYAGLHAKYNPLGREGMAATKELLATASEALKRPVAMHSGMLRLATSEELRQDYLQCVAKNPDVKWLSAVQCAAYAPHSPAYEGIFIDEAITVYPSLYLEGLWKACENKGAKLEKVACESLESLNDYDAIVVATGASATKFPELKYLPIHSVKGQLIAFEWREGMAPLSIPLNSLGYLVMDPSGKTCFAGSTYERNYQTHGPDLQTAMQEIMPKVLPMLPKLNEFKVVDCRAGIRATTLSRMPICQKVSGKIWVLAGLGSRGLLYHALMAKKLAEQIAGQ